MGHTFETREEFYEFYDWMQEPELKAYLDKIPLEKIKLSMASNGLNPESVCLCGAHNGCMCNTCQMNREKK